MERNDHGPAAKPGSAGPDATANDAVTDDERVRAWADRAESTQSPIEHGGPSGPEPTRYGDWERKGRCIDF